MTTSSTFEAGAVTQNEAPLLIKNDQGEYLITKPVSLNQLCSITSELLGQALLKAEKIESPSDTTRFLQNKLALVEYEVFSCVFLDNKHQVIAFEELFRGTIDRAAIYPREVVKRCLHHNAAALILSHNHPSGVPEPSRSDVQITEKLQSALALIDVRVLDHIVIGANQFVSMAERGLL